MGAAYFYQLSHSPLESALSLLAGRALQAGWRVAIRAQSAEQIAWLDDQLWTLQADSFLPHGRSDAPFAEAQPILLTMAQAHPKSAPNAPDCVISVDGAEISPEEISGIARACIVFDGAFPDALTRAREQWKAIVAAGVSAQYWSEAQGRWQKMAESGAS
ncbi:MAG: DNA polymerase III subunit chi [Paracoccaceae bacterium]|nr:DNA polymerase III subunit chi [Paracoccaceae bacterium]MDP5345741.1 DNA polymerase III subunit chi [Paracoccaceae bacterium]